MERVVSNLNFEDADQTLLINGTFLRLLPGSHIDI